MKKNELERIIDEETAASEASRDDSLSERAARKGQTRSVVYSLRLTPEQAEEIQRIAEDAGVPTSALVRDWVVEGLRTERGTSTLDSLVETLSRDVDKIRRRVARREAS